MIMTKPRWPTFFISSPIVIICAHCSAHSEVLNHANLMFWYCIFSPLQLKFRRKFTRKGCAAGRHIDCFSTDVSMVLGLVATETMIFFELQGVDIFCKKLNLHFAVNLLLLYKNLCAYKLSIACKLWFRHWILYFSYSLARFMAILGTLISKTSCSSCVAVAIAVIFEVDFSISEEILQIITTYMFTVNHSRK